MGIVRGATLRGVTITDNLYTIGTPGARDFGVAVYQGALPANFSALAGTATRGHSDFGNYQYQDSSFMVWIPKFYYKISTLTIDVKGIDTYATTALANADGYALHRAFIDGGSEKDGFFIDKYMCSQNTYGGKEIASSIKNGLPISTDADHNSIVGLTACDMNAYWETIDAAKGRGSSFHVASRLQYSALAMLSMAHGQTSSSTTNCAWYDATNNFPKGCNNNALGDINDNMVVWESDGYSNCGKTGSAGYGGGAGNEFAKLTHNGQACGVADLNGLMWEVSLGLTAIRTTNIIEAMSSANPCVVTWTGHGMSTGAYVQVGDTDITQVDWTALNDKIYAITVIDANSFSLDGVDSSAWAAYDAAVDPGQIHKATFYATKQATAMKDFTSDNSSATGHWGATGVAAMMDSFTPMFETGYASNGCGQRFGSGANQVLSEATSGTGWLLSGLGFPKDKDGIDTTGTNLFGKDYFYQCLKNELCLLSCGGWNYLSGAGAWYVAWNHHRTASSNYVGFRAACYFDQPSDNEAMVMEIHSEAISFLF